MSLRPLDDEQFAELLQRRAEVEAATADEADVAELQAVREALRSYREELMARAEMRSTALPVPHPAARLMMRSSQWWVLTACAVMLLMMAGGRWFEDRPAAMSAAPTVQSLDEDNRLLSSVTSALEADGPATAGDLGLPETGDDPAEQD